MSALTLVREVMQHVIMEDLEPVLHLIGDDVTLTVLRPGGGAESFERLSGKDAVREYFAFLGGIVGFWQLRFVDQKSQILVLGQERYTTTGGIESATDLAFVLQVREGSITNIYIVEDLTVVLGAGVGVRLVESRTAAMRPTLYLDYSRPDAERASA